VKGQKVSTFFAGFLVLFFLYHAAEYFVLFNSNPALFLGIQFVFFIAAHFIAKWQKCNGITAWALQLSKGWWLQMLMGMVAGIFLYGLSFYISSIINRQTIQPLNLSAESLNPFFLFAFGVFFSSLSEDILTRGYLFRHIRAKTPSGLFIFTSALIYLLNHIWRLHDGWQTITYLFLLGIVFAIPLVYSNRLWFTAGMHWLGNATFFFTQNILQSSGGDDRVSPNGVFIVCILFMIPVCYLLLPKLPYMQSNENLLAAFKDEKIFKAP
jgi:membrane protease YdiL (CAAX protease family)